MKSPTELAAKLARQWQNADTRELRLLHPESWPIRLNIGKPTGKVVTEQLDQVRQHLDRWRRINVGRVHWENIRFRSASDAVEIPVTWELSKPSEWIAATGCNEIRREHQQLDRLVTTINPMFHQFLIRQRHLVLEKPASEVIKAAEVAQLLQQGYAEGSPLRALSVAGIDSKFFERNRALIVQMLDIRFDGQVSDLGLEGFLGALDESDHWLLLADMDGTRLPFSQQRVRDNELAETPLPASCILIVENERCLHQLPNLPDTIAILGAGLNLTWMAAPWLNNKMIAYWGDIDTWGLTMLARARQYQPQLSPLLMTEAVFNHYSQERAVQEPQVASTAPPTGLTQEEKRLFNQLLSLTKGRLEQEFLPKEEVVQAVAEWARAREVRNNYQTSR